MDKPLAAFYIILVSAILGLSDFLPRSIGNLLVLAAFLVFLGTTLTTSFGSDLKQTIQTFRYQGDIELQPSLRPEPSIVFPVVILWAIFLIDLVLNPSFSALLRAGAFVFISLVVLFVVPKVISREQAYRAIGVVGAGCMLLGLPSALTDSNLQIAGVVLSSTTGAPLDPAGIIVHSPTAIFETQNYYRVLVAIGTVASAGVFYRTRSPWMLLACALNGAGVYLTLGRAARYATIIAAGLAVVYLVAGRRALAGVTALGAFVTIIMFASALGVLPTIGPAATLHGALDTRLGYWSAAYETVMAHPVLGSGLVDTEAAVGARYDGNYTGVHNSYLRMFLIGGITGGVAYLALCVTALATAFRRVSERAPLALTTFCLIVMGLVFQLFAGGTIFGTSLSSVLWALPIGYAQLATGDQTNPFSSTKSRPQLSDSTQS